MTALSLRPQLLAARILIVDDVESNVMFLQALLEMNGFSNLQCLTDSREVIPAVQREEADIILLDLMMPHLSGFEVMEALHEVLPSSTFLPILVLTADMTQETKQKALASGAMDFLTKPLEVTEVLQRTQNLLHTRFLHKQQQAHSQHLEDLVKKRTQVLAETITALERANQEILMRLAKVAEYRDDTSGEHTQRVGKLAYHCAKVLGKDENYCLRLEQAARLHDIGKIGIADSILQKPGSLSPEEMALMHKHCEIGAHLLEDSQLEVLKLARSIALNHHERWDGKGYPQSLKQDEIPLEGRIVAVADVYDALTHSKPYRRAWTIEEARVLIRRESGCYFDPTVVEAFFAVLETQHGALEASA
ncbi:MAG: response regulator [Trueperaceae bacterium]|nr:response regulator [Trueperaceae bacterium]